MRRETLLDFFHDFATIDGVFLAYDDGYRRRTHTYAQVSRSANAFARRLEDAGLAKGDKVIFWGENRPEWIACYWGCLLRGLIVVPIDYRSSPDFVKRVGGLVQARLLLVGDDTSAHAAEAADGRPTWPFADFDWDDDGPAAGTATPADDVGAAVPIARDDIIQIIFTSGATAEPKGVVIRHRNVMANVVPVEREVIRYRRYAWPFQPLRFVNLLPLSHMFGQSMATTIPPMVRGTVIFTRSFNPNDLLTLIHARRVSVLVCVPKILDVLREHVLHLFPESGEAPPPGTSIPGRWWRYRRVHRALGLKFWAFVVGAAPLGPELEEFWRRMGFAVIQGYGLTETAPIVTLNHPFHTSKGSVGTPIAGVDIRIADDGEILVRGENVTSGYYGDPEPIAGEDGWLHTGDIGEQDAEGRIFIRGRKKEMIVTSDGLNVFPEDVERVLAAIPGVRDSAVVGARSGSTEHVHAVLVLDPGVEPDAIVRAANARLPDAQKIRGASVWASGALPRTEGTSKLKRRAIADWVNAGTAPAPSMQGDSVEALLARFAHGRPIDNATTLDDLGLSSLDRVELMVALEDQFRTRIDETRFPDAASVADIKRLLDAPAAAPEDAPVSFPTWNRAWPVRVVRRASLATWILPLARVFAHVRVEGLEHLAALPGPVVFASNHQSHMDVPAILAALPGHWRARVAPAMAKEFFKAHFFPAGFTRRQRVTNSLNYYLAAAFFNAFPLPQREAGTRQALRYVGDLLGAGWSVLIFPEGARSTTGAIAPFRGGIGMIASRLDVPVVPVRIDGTGRVLPTGSSRIHGGPVRVAFGEPMRLRGDDYAALAARVEAAVRDL